MSPTRANIDLLHELYNELTGYDIRFDLGGARERVWFDWIKAGFTDEDLRRVVTYILRGIREGKRHRGALKFSNLIGMPDKFEEDLAEARAVFRPRPKPPVSWSAQARRDGPAAAAPDAGHTAAEIIQGYDNLKKMLKP